MSDTDKWQTLRKSVESMQANTDGTADFEAACHWAFSLVLDEMTTIEESEPERCDG